MRAKDTSDGQMSSMGNMQEGCLGNRSLEAINDRVSATMDELLYMSDSCFTCVIHNTVINLKWGRKRGSGLIDSSTVGQLI